ncbi:MAG: 2'-5' RNA ligase family protein [Treponema sp.]|jgi:2'-5' RNA ligase|nr:2'-5' RNA ligase family protein [Treponema sp.]
MKKRNTFPQQTHFLGVIVPDDITSTLEDCRRFMNRKYGCKSGHSTPIHITLVPPFRLPEEFCTKDLSSVIQQYVLSDYNISSFVAHIDNFDAFADRTIFAKVSPSAHWTNLRDKVLAAVLMVAPTLTKKDMRPFQPHLTVANRDIPAGASIEALQVLNELNFFEDFQVDNITIFERINEKWKTASIFSI